MTNTITKLALVVALLVSTLSAASAQFSGSHDNSPDFYSQQKNSPADEPNKTDVGENGG